MADLALDVTGELVSLLPQDAYVSINIKATRSRTGKVNSSIRVFVARSEDDDHESFEAPTLEALVEKVRRQYA